jgi:dipeptidyl aminopeptidase/acylaminoacyl peptidase
MAENLNLVVLHDTNRNEDVLPVTHEDAVLDADGKSVGTKLTELEEKVKIEVEEDTASDLEFSDNRDNVLVKFSEGHVETKYFDSRDIDNIGFSQIDEDFKISDKNGYDIVAFSEGHIKTKYFDSRNINIYKTYTEGLIIFDLPDVECSPLGSTNVINKTDVIEEPSANISIKKDAYGCLYLPETYSKNGEPTKLILFATGGHTFLDREHGWMPSSQDWVNNTIKDLTNRGYAVFGASIPGVTYDTWVSMGNYGVPMGLPDIMESTYRAYLYIVGNYNVCKQIYIWGCSEGGLLALNWGIIHRDIVSAIAHCAGCVSSYSEWISYGSWKTLRKRMSDILDFSDKSGDLIVSSYEHDKADVFDPYTRLLNINNAFYIYGWNTPIHFFWGTSDDVLTTDSIIGEKSNYNVNFHRAIINSGGISFFKWYNGYNHSDVAMGKKEIVREDVINWFNHF